MSVACVSAHRSERRPWTLSTTPRCGPDWAGRIYKGCSDDALVLAL